MPAGRGSVLRSIRPLFLVGLSFLFLAGNVHARCFGVPSEVGDVLWSVSITAKSELGYADGGTFGVAPGATNLFDDGLDEFEPAGSEEVKLRLFFFLEQVLKFPSAKFNKSFIASSDFMDWVLKVEHLEKRLSEVTLTWDVREVLSASEPVGLRLIDGYDSIDMLSTTSYTYDATQGTRTFAIVAEPVEDGGSFLPIVLVVAAYGGAIVVYFLLRWIRKKPERLASNI
ncbi:MAG: hypothetical protein ACE5HJ_07085 [Thermoplasmata archaeon]